MASGGDSVWHEALRPLFGSCRILWADSSLAAIADRQDFQLPACCGRPSVWICGCYCIELLQHCPGERCVLQEEGLS